MKRTLILAAAALLMAACAGEKGLAPEQISSEAELVEYTFTVGADTKAAISDAGEFSWAAGDEIAHWDAQNNTFDKYTAQSAGTSTTITGSGAADANYTKAYYPYGVASVAAGENAIVWPASYESAAVAAKGFPMMAVNNSGSFSFKQLGALLKITIADLPSNVSSLVFNANLGVSGTLAVDATDADKPFCAPGSAASSIEIATDGATKDGDNTIFYLPLPAGTLTGGFSIDFKLGAKVVGSKATTKDVAVGRAQLIPMKAFTPVFNWPKATDAFDYGYAKNESHKASYEGCTIAKDSNTPTVEPYTLLDGVTYYPNLTYGKTYFKTGAKPGPENWTNQEEYGKVIPAHRCFSWKINRPGKFDYACCMWNNKSARPVSYKLAILKTVNGVTSATTLIDFTPEESAVHECQTDGSNPASSCYHEFVVTAEDLLGIDEAATLYFYGYQKSKMNITIYHFPITWTPSVDE